MRWENRKKEERSEGRKKGRKEKAEEKGRRGEEEEKEGGRLPAGPAVTMVSAAVRAPAMTWSSQRPRASDTQSSLRRHVCCLELKTKTQVSEQVTGDDWHTCHHTGSIRQPLCPGQATTKQSGSLLGPTMTAHSMEEVRRLSEHGRMRVASVWGQSKNANSGHRAGRAKCAEWG